MSKVIYDNDDWILVHLYSDDYFINKAILCNNSYTNFTTLDLTKTVNNTFYVLIADNKFNASESPIEHKQAFTAHIQINADDVVINIADKETIILKRIQPCS